MNTIIQIAEQNSKVASANLTPRSAVERDWNSPMSFCAAQNSLPSHIMVSRFDLISVEFSTPALAASRAPIRHPCTPIKGWLKNTDCQFCELDLNRKWSLRQSFFSIYLPKWSTHSLTATAEMLVKLLIQMSHFQLRISDLSDGWSRLSPYSWSLRPKGLKRAGFDDTPPASQLGVCTAL